MASIDSLKASDGSGNASVATVQSTRSGGATTIVVDTVQGINTNFFATMGTPHTFQDPVTGEDITIISEATAVDFKGHVDGANLEIDAIAPGYTDDGSAVGDIVIIKPTTEWADEVADILEVAHDDDGKLKADAPITGGYDLSALVNGWVNANESWTYDGWTAATRIATITVPTDATTKYQNGDKVKFTQPTDGIKYGIIVKVAATLLTVFLPNGLDFDNEAITAPYYSRAKTPQGFNADPRKWTVELISTTQQSRASTSYGTLTDAITLGPGAWELSWTGSLRAEQSSGTGYNQAYFALSTSTSSVSDDDLVCLVIWTSPSSAVMRVGQTAHLSKKILLSAETTYTMIGKSTTGTIYLVATLIPTTLRATCAYL